MLQRLANRQRACILLSGYSQERLARRSQLGLLGVSGRVSFVNLPCCGKFLVALIVIDIQRAIFARCVTAPLLDNLHCFGGPFSCWWCHFLRLRSALFGRLIVRVGPDGFESRLDIPSYTYCGQSQLHVSNVGPPIRRHWR